MTQEELKLIINELVYNIKNKNYDLSLYFLYWLIKYDKMTIKKKNKFVVIQDLYQKITKIIMILYGFYGILFLKKGNSNLSKETYIQIVALYKLEIIL